jgi:site-specific DNA-adenine methylase
MKLILRFGSKDTDIKYFDEYLPLDVKKVAEAFGGSFAIIRKIYYDDKYEKYVNDNDKTLFYYYKHPEVIVKNLKKMRNLIDKYGDDSILFLKSKSNDPKYHEVLKMFTPCGFTNIPENLDYDDSIKLMKKIHFSNMNYYDFIKKFQYDKDTFLFLDPPYLDSYNDEYESKNDSENVKNILDNIYNIIIDPKTQSKIMLIINKTPYTNKLFKNFIKKKYIKIYQITKRKKILLVITNY